jgi:hypothetical protein
METSAVAATGYSKLRRTAFPETVAFIASIWRPFQSRGQAAEIPYLPLVIYPIWVVVASLRVSVVRLGGPRGQSRGSGAADRPSYRLGIIHDYVEG